MDSIDLQLENRSLRRQFEAMKLDSYKVCPALIGELERETLLLRDLMDWVQTYKRTPNREKMETQGYDFPPVTPDIDPDTDWLLFENWINRKPTAMSLGDIDEFFRIKDVDLVTDEEINNELDTIYGLLSKCSISIELVEELPPKLEYNYLREELKDEDFQHLAPGMTMHIDGCSCFCPECVQRPWCERGMTKFDEDIEAGRMVVPSAVNKYLKFELPPLDKLQDYY